MREGAFGMGIYNSRIVPFISGRILTHIVAHAFTARLSSISLSLLPTSLQL